MMTGSQIREENMEFEKLYKINKMAMGNVKDESQTKYQKSVFTSEMKNQKEREKKIEELEKSIKNRREERDWQPAHLLLTRCGIPDPHEKKKIKPPMYFKNMD
jgi:hypothetical protein